MTTNLLLGYSDIPRRGTLTASVTADTSYPEANVCLGPRRKKWRSGSATTIHYLTWDLGSGVTQAVNFLWLGRAVLLTKKDSTSYVDLQSSSDNSAWTSRLTMTPVTSYMAGPRLEDAVRIITTTSAFRYWRLKFYNAGASNVTPQLSKAFFGTAFDLGRDPRVNREMTREMQASGQREPRWLYTLNWTGITDTLVQSFISNIVNYQDVMSLVPMTNGYSEPLNGDLAVPCKILEFSYKVIKKNRNDLKLTLIEEI